MLWVGDERSADAQDELGVDLAVGVFGRVEERYVKFRRCDFAVGHGNVGLELSNGRSWLAKVGPLDVLVLHDSTGQTGAVAVGNGFGQNERTRGDVEVFFLLGVNPFHHAFDDEGAEVDLTAGQLGQVVLRQAGGPVVQNQERTENSSLVGVDEDVFVFHVVSNGNFGGDNTTAS